jgi:hypothetical protein
MLQKKRGVRRAYGFSRYISSETNFHRADSRRGVASKSQKQFRTDLLAAGGGEWWLVRSAHAGMTALLLSGVEFCRRWKPPRLEPWEGPFADLTRRLPQEPDVAAERAAARRRWRERQAGLASGPVARRDQSTRVANEPPP